jgi:hypothetical protein
MLVFMVHVLFCLFVDCCPLSTLKYIYDTVFILGSNVPFPAPSYFDGRLE